MELDNIEKLVEKYFEAETSLVEEEQLKAYFSQEQIAPHLAKYAPLFGYFSKAKEEAFSKQLTLDNAVNVTKTKFNYKWLAVAAVGLLMFGIYFGNQYSKAQDLEQVQAQLAYQETKKALNLLAENFNRGTEKVAYLNQFEETKQKIYNEK